MSNTQTVHATTGANAAQVAQTVGYGYDAAGRINSIVYPSGRKATITYAHGLPTAIGLAANGTAVATPLLTDIQWTAFGPVLRWNWQTASGAVPHDRMYDGAGRLVRYRLGELLRDLSYDAADRISGYTHYDANNGAAQSARNETFVYDELGRLTQTTLGAGSWAFSYDANGNRTARTVNGTTSSLTISPTSNRITAATNPARSFAYDNAGNTTNDGQFSASYDLTGRMVTPTKAGVTTTYAYDSLGRRVRKHSSSGGRVPMFVQGQRPELERAAPSCMV